MIFKMSKKLQTINVDKYTVNVCENSFLKKKKYGAYTLEVKFDGKSIYREFMGRSDANKKVKLANNEEQLSILYFTDNGYSQVYSDDSQDHFITGNIVNFNVKTGEVMNSKYYTEAMINKAFSDFRSIETSLKNKQHEQQNGMKM